MECGEWSGESRAQRVEWNVPSGQWSVTRAARNGENRKCMEWRVKCLRRVFCVSSCVMLLIDANSASHVCSRVLWTPTGLKFIGVGFLVEKACGQRFDKSGFGFDAP